MLQDLSPYQYKNEYKPVPPDKNSFLLCYSGDKVLLKQTEKGILFPTFAEAEAHNDKERLYKEYTYLFAIDNMRFYLGENLSYEDFAEYSWEDIHIFRNAHPKHLRFAGITGWQLYQWYGSRRYCGCCGKPMIKDGKERMMRCPECGHTEYPKICPAVIIAVTHGNKLLMAKYAGRRHANYVLLAGFAEIGETIEDTVKREVMEETGIKVKNITYYKSQPWSFTDTLLMGFFCELDGDTGHLTIDETELALAEWVKREDIEGNYDDFSLTNEMIMAFKENTISKGEGI